MVRSAVPVALLVAALLPACERAPAPAAAPAAPSPPASPPSAPGGPDPSAGPVLPEITGEALPPPPEQPEQAPQWPRVPAQALPVKAASPRAGTAGPPPDDLGALGRVRWGDRSYPTSCLSSGTARLTGGTATEGPARVRLRPPVFGDLQGDGTVEALVTLTCTDAQRRPDRALLFAAGPDGGPRLLGAVAEEDDRLVVDQVEFRDGLLRLVGLGYSRAAELPEPDFAVTRVAAADGDGVRVTEAFADPITILYEGDEHDETATDGSS